MERKHIACWNSGKDCKISKALVEGAQQGRAIKLLNMSRQQLSVVIGLLTGHLDLNGQLHKIGKDIFGELQQLSHVPVDLFRRFATEIELAGK